MDSTAQTSPRDSENINEGLSSVTHGFDSTYYRRDSEITNELLSRVTHGSIAQTAHRDSEIINKLISRVTHGFDRPNSL